MGVSIYIQHPVTYSEACLGTVQPNTQPTTSLNLRYTSMPCGVKRTLTDPHTRLVSGRKQESGSGVGGRHHPQQLAGPGGGHRHHIKRDLCHSHLSRNHAGPQPADQRTVNQGGPGSG